MAMNVDEVMVKDVVTVMADASIRAAAELMNHCEIGCLVVVNGKKPIGILTERDMLKKIIVEAREPHKTRVIDIMSKSLITATPNTNVGKAAKLMFERKIKKLPIVENEQLVGLVTLSDLMRSEEIIDLLHSIPINGAPKRMIKVLSPYFADSGSRFVKRRKRKCPIIRMNGDTIGCQMEKCMWWLGDECAITKLTRKMTYDIP